MLHPGTCSATWSFASTCVGCPGEAATHAASRPSSGVRFGPPTAAAPVRRSWWTRWVSQSGSAKQSESVYAITSPVAARSPALRAALSPSFSWWITLKCGMRTAECGTGPAVPLRLAGSAPRNRERTARVSSVDPSSTTITS